MEDEAVVDVEEHGKGRAAFRGSLEQVEEEEEDFQLESVR